RAGRTHRARAPARRPRRHPPSPREAHQHLHRGGPGMRGIMHIVNSIRDLTLSANPRSCVLTATIHQTNVIAGGTGQFAAAAGAFAGLRGVGGRPAQTPPESWGGAGPLASAAGRAVAWVAVMRGGLEGQRAGVDAIAPACGGGPVAEDMAQMTAAAAADHLGAAQQPALVRPEL